MDNKTHHIRYQLLHLRHQGAILRGFIEKKDYKYKMYWGASGTCLLYVFDSDLEAHVNMWSGVTDGLDREMVVTVQRVLKLVRRIYHTSWWICKKSRGSQRSIGDANLLSLHFSWLFPYGKLGWHLAVRYQGDATSHNNNRMSCRNLPRTDCGSSPMGTHCSVVLQNCFCMQVPRRVPKWMCLVWPYHQAQAN
jgi:hypothetical protein